MAFKIEGIEMYTIFVQILFFCKVFKFHCCSFCLIKQKSQLTVQVCCLFLLHSRFFRTKTKSRFLVFFLNPRGFFGLGPITSALPVLQSQALCPLWTCCNSKAGQDHRTSQKMHLLCQNGLNTLAPRWFQ